MAVFSQIKNGVVVNNIVVDESRFETEEQGIIFCKSLLGQDTEWMMSQDESGGASRNKCAHMGDAVEDGKFISRQPYKSWIRDGDNWYAPKTKPESEAPQAWDEQKQAWVEVVLPKQLI